MGFLLFIVFDVSSSEGVVSGVLRVVANGDGLNSRLTIVSIECIC